MSLPTTIVPVASPGAPSVHEYVTQEVRFGSGAFFQARCSCGWLCGIAHRVAVSASEYQKRSAELIARGEFEAHYAAAVSA